MSREIKFRAWDIESQNWNYSDVMPDIGFMKWCKYDSTTKIYQYTGLKDRKGVEIYEGDIIQGGTRLADEVIFRDGSFQTAGGYKIIYTDSVIGNIYENSNLLERTKYESN